MPSIGVATWDKWDPKADRFSIYVRGLSDGYKEVPAPPSGGKPTVKYKTLRIDFIRRGDEHNLEREGNLLERPALRVGLLVRDSVASTQPGVA